MSGKWKGQVSFYVPGVLIAGVLARIGWEIGGWLWFKLVS